MTILGCINLRNGNVEFPVKGDVETNFFNNDEITVVISGYCFVLPMQSLSAYEIAMRYKQAYNVDFIKNVDGAFWIAISDKKNKQCYLIRDPLGQEEIYYTIVDELIYFTTHVYMMRQHGIDLNIDRLTLAQTFLFQMTIYNQTIFSNINSVASGTVVHFFIGESVAKKYKEISFTCQNDYLKSEEEYIHALSIILQDSIKRIIKDNSTFAVLLSGGLDSSLIAYLYQKQLDQQIMTFSIAQQDEQYDENLYQEQMSKFLGSKHHQLHMDDESIVSGLLELAPKLNKPIFSPGAIGIYQLSKHIHQAGFKSALCGQGADELFGGYSWFVETYAREIIKKIEPTDSNEYLFRYAHSMQETVLRYQNLLDHELILSYGLQLAKLLSVQLDEKIFKPIIPFMDIWNPSVELLKRNRIDQDISELQRLQYYAIELGLKEYALTVLGNHVSKLNTVSILNPFLDACVLDLAGSLPDHMKISGLKEKFLLKRFSESILPAQIVNRRKHPYKLKCNVNNILMNNAVQQLLDVEGVFDQDYIQYLVKNKRMKRSLLFGILSTQAILCGRNLK